MPANTPSIRSVKDTRGAGSSRAGRYGWSVAMSLMLGAFASGSGCFAEESVTSESPDTRPICEVGANQGDKCTTDCTTSCGNSLGTKFCRCEGGVYTQCPCLAPPPDEFPVALEQPYCDRASGATSALIANDCSGRIGLRCIGAEEDLNTKLKMVCSCELRPGAVDPSIMFAIWGCEPAGEQSGLPTCESIGTGQVVPDMNNRACPKEWDACIGRDYDALTETPKGCFCIKEPNGTLLWTCGSSNKWIIPEQ